VLRTRTVVVTAVATVSALASALTSAAAGAAAMHPAVLKVASVKVSMGTTNKSHPVIVDAKGLPVYLLTGDSPMHPLCKGSCLTYWPAVTATSAKVTLGPGIKGKVGVWHHNKINQVTLNGHPLYTFVQDGKGSALGEGVKSFGGVWEVIGANGSPMAKSSSHSSSGSSNSGW
jgi:predicted lipoprotein with Yx(FWY)xxD motif